MPQESNESSAPSVTPQTEQGPGFGAYASTLAAVGIGAALIEVELIPGILIGAGAMLMPNLVPKVLRAFRPALKGAVRAGYKVAQTTRETVAEASEQFQDVMAEVRAEAHVPESGTSEPAAATPGPGTTEASHGPREGGKRKPS